MFKLDVEKQNPASLLNCCSLWPRSKRFNLFFLRVSPFLPLGLTPPPLKATPFFQLLSLPHLLCFFFPITCFPVSEVIGWRSPSSGGLWQENSWRLWHQTKPRHRPYVWTPPPPGCVRADEKDSLTKSCCGADRWEPSWDLNGQDKSFHQETWAFSLGSHSPLFSLIFVCQVTQMLGGGSGEGTGGPAWELGFHRLLLQLIFTWTQKEDDGLMRGCV